MRRINCSIFSDSRDLTLYYATRILENENKFMSYMWFMADHAGNMNGLDITIDY